MISNSISTSTSTEQINAYLNAVSRTNQTLTNDDAGLPLIFDITKSNQNIDINAAGEITLNFAGYYSYFIKANAEIRGNTDEVEVWVESFVNGAWVYVEDLADKINVSDGSFYFNGVAFVTETTIFRMVIRHTENNATRELVAEQLENGYTIPSCLINIIRN